MYTRLYNSNVYIVVKVRNENVERFFQYLTFLITNNYNVYKTWNSNALTGPQAPQNKEGPIVVKVRNEIFFQFNIIVFKITI